MAVARKSEERDVSASREVLKIGSRLVRRTVADRLSGPREALSGLAERAASNGKNGGVPFAERIRSIPIQCSVDIAVPLELAYEEWLKLEFLPEGAHRVEDIERDGDRLKGRIAGALASRSRWRAEIREERPGESFAWRSLDGSDCLGLVTFHRLAERLTRLELELDVVPRRAPEAFELLVHVADRRAEADLRRFKADLERISPEDYPSSLDEPDDEPDDDVQNDNDEEE